MNVWKAIQRLFWNPEAARARRVAVDAVREILPHVDVAWWPSVRAREPDRWVFAVFYQDRQWPSRPNPYKLVAVALTSYSTTLLDPPRESPYWIRNYK